MANIKAHLATLILAAEAQIQMGFFHCAFSPNVQREDKWTTGKKGRLEGLEIRRTDKQGLKLLQSCPVVNI